MSTRNEATRRALQGLLLLVVECLNVLRNEDFDGDDKLGAIEDVIDVPAATDLIQLARAALDTPADPPNRKTFYGLVTQFECDEKSGARHGGRGGPIVFEQLLTDATADRSHVEARIASGAFSQYGWNAIATITVDFPVATPAAIPAAVAGVHN